MRETAHDPLWIGELSALKQRRDASCLGTSADGESDLAANSHRWIERCHRTLEDESELVASKRTQLFVASRKYGAPFIDEVAIQTSRFGWQQAAYRHSQR